MLVVVFESFMCSEQSSEARSLKHYIFWIITKHFSLSIYSAISVLLLWGHAHSKDFDTSSPCTQKNNRLVQFKNRCVYFTPRQVLKNCPLIIPLGEGASYYSGGYPLVFLGGTTRGYENYPLSRRNIEKGVCRNIYGRVLVVIYFVPHRNIFRPHRNTLRWGRNII